MKGTDEPVTTIFKFGELQGRKCISMKSEEKDAKFENSPRWMGWIPLDEIEQVED